MTQRTIQDLIDDLGKAEQQIIAALPKIVTEYATNSNNLVIANIQKEGLEGKSYSTEPYYAEASVFNRKSAFKPRGKYHASSKRGKAKFKDDGSIRKSMYLDEGYQELRQLNGLQTSHVDLTFSGRMMQNIQVLKIEAKSDTHLSAIIGASDTENKKKLEGNHKHYGDFLRPNQQITDLVKDIPFKRVVSILETVINLKSK